ncbi:ATP-binding protein [uncultured Senegalimassilia sp.]|uniref:ATP-binding protein n=1 Tax=uncultured Senegalimassilia sp. TaxID=1714350 RepID=UPI0025EDEDF8|nr:ATP-binding protein [uncultured Senegalimassilia sp.]
MRNERKNIGTGASADTGKSAAKGKRKISLLRALMVSLAVIVLIQGALPISVLAFSGLKGTLEGNAISIDARAVDNRKVNLESAMLKGWAGISRETAALNSTLSDQLARSGLDVPGFLADDAQKEAFIAAVFPRLLSVIGSNTTSGVYLILGNDGDLSVEQDHIGAFLRDSDPNSSSDSYSDLLLERGDKELARNTSIALDNTWAPKLHLAGNGMRSADDFFYKPYEAALQNPGVEAKALAYWSQPFVLEGNPNDSYRMIAYSLPLMYEGRVYGVLGIEVSTAYLADTCFPISELSGSEAGGYALALANDDGSYQIIAGNGALYNAVGAEGPAFTLAETRNEGLMNVEGVSMGEQQVYAITEPLKLYSGIVPYDDTDWTVVGLFSEDSIFAAGNSLYHRLGVTIGLTTIGCLVLVVLVSRAINRPLRGLIEGVQGGIEKLRTFRTSVAEVDQLHGVILDLTEDGLEKRRKLNEEKERYRLAVKGTNDAFFTFHPETGSIEIMNSLDDGEFDAVRFWDLFRRDSATPEAVDAIEKAVSRMQETSIQVKVVTEHLPQGRWLEVSSSRVQDADNGQDCMVCVIRDIDDRKRREIEAARKQELDPVTSTYRFEPGMDAIAAARVGASAGQLAVIEVDGFANIVRDYGIPFGDVLLNEQAKVMHAFNRDRENRNAILVRAGAGQFVCWIPDRHADEAIAQTSELQRRFAQLVRPGVLELSFHAGGASSEGVRSTSELLRRARVALQASMEHRTICACWEPFMDDMYKPKPFDPISSFGNVEDMSLPALTLNLLDRRLSVAAGMDLLVRRLDEKLGVTNVFITSFHEDYQTASVRYFFGPIPGIDEGAVFPLSREAVETLQRFGEQGLVHPVGEMPIFAMCEEVRACCGGIAFPMMNAGKYSGSVFFLSSAGATFDDEAANTLREVGTVIQNRINQEDLDQSAQAKSDFLARMSHEIRTPMNGIIGMTEIALRPGQDDARRVDCLNKVRASSLYLLDLLNGILDMTKIENDRMTLNDAPFSMDHVVEELNAVCAGRLAARDQKLVVDMRMRHDRFMGDALRLNQVLINLVGNAVKYSHDGGTITVTIEERTAASGAAAGTLMPGCEAAGAPPAGAANELRADCEAAGADARATEGAAASTLPAGCEAAEGGPQPADREAAGAKERAAGNDARRASVYFAVADEGVGIAEEDIERIFAKFEQVDATDARQQGTGLGLAISNRIVLMMGDRIHANSRLGHGSTFYFEVPLPIADTVGTPACGDVEQIDFTGKRALVAEDNELNMEIIAYVLADMGFTVDKAMNGKEAVDAFEQSPAGRYDVILMDVMMPVMDGLAAAHRIRGLNRADAAEIPIVATSANAFAEDVKRSIASGMNAHVPKPIDSTKLAKVLAEVMR